MFARCLTSLASAIKKTTASRPNARTTLQRGEPGGGKKKFRTEFLEDVGVS